MRVEYTFSLDRIEVPCFSVETTEGPTKLFTLTTLIVNVLAEKGRADVIFHSPNREDLPKKIVTFENLLRSAPVVPHFKFVQGEAGSSGSSYYQWISIQTSGDRASR
jgi:hypothetical protein